MKSIITGNPVDGFAFYGPFNDGDDVSDLSVTDGPDEWWTAQIRQPEAGPDQGVG